jgi:hypothetical protein
MTNLLSKFAQQASKVARQTFVGILMPQKLHQVIFNISITSGPTTGRVSFSTVFDGVAFVTLYQDGVQIRGAFVLPFAPSNYSVSFTDLPQDTSLGVQIAITDPRPPGQQLPGGIVIHTSVMDTGLRTASVTLRSLKELQGEAEITFITRLYDFDGTAGNAISAQLQYGRGHMDPDGNAIGDPFGPPLFFEEAPDAIAIYTQADIQTSGLFGFGEGIGILGFNLGDAFPNDAPNHTVADSDSYTAAQTIVTLPNDEGPYSIPFDYTSGLFDYMFEVKGHIDGTVSPINHVGLRAITLNPGQLKNATALAASPRATVVAGAVLLSFHLMVDGSVARLRAGARTQTDLERLGDVTAERLVAAGRPDGEADLLALRRDASLLHARAGKAGAVAWRELRMKLAAEPAVARAPDGALHVFGIEADSTLVHAAIVADTSRTPRWDRFDQGFAGHLSCACNGTGEAHLLVRRGADVVHARLALAGGKINSPSFETMPAPFAGPVVVGATDDGGFAALGCDDHHIFWLKIWDGRSWQPAGSKWERIGTIDDLFPPKKAKGAPGAKQKLASREPSRRRASNRR